MRASASSRFLSGIRRSTPHLLLPFFPGHRLLPGLLHLLLCEVLWPAPHVHVLPSDNALRMPGLLSGPPPHALLRPERLEARELREPLHRHHHTLGLKPELLGHLPRLGLGLRQRLEGAAAFSRLGAWIHDLHLKVSVCLAVDASHSGPRGFGRDGLRGLQLALAHQLLAVRLGLRQRGRHRLVLGEALLHVLGDREGEILVVAGFFPPNSPARHSPAPANVWHPALAFQAAEALPPLGTK